eukprot:2879995-Pyramimonas_sp.AAC.1
MPIPGTNHRRGERIYPYLSRRWSAAAPWWSRSSSGALAVWEGARGATDLPAIRLTSPTTVDALSPRLIGPPC